MATANDFHALLSLQKLVLLALLGITAPSCFGAEPLRITPSVGVRETITDNVDLAPDDLKRTDFITEIMPAVRITADGARVKLRLNYQVNAILRARDSSNNDIQNSLDASATAEAIEHFLFIDARSAITQVAISPYGPRPPSDANFTSNRTESRTFEVSPYIRGTAGRFADYEARYRFTDSRTTSGDVGRSRVEEISGHLTGVRSGPVGWSADAVSQAVRTANLSSAHLDSAVFHPIYVYEDLRFIGDIGVERQDVTTDGRSTHAYYGLGAEWLPTPRTNIAARWDRRYLANTWTYTVQHRFPFLVVSLVDTRTVTTNAQLLASVDAGLAYDLLYNALAGRIPDPIERATETQRLLQQGGIPADLNLPLTFASTGLFVNRRQQLSLGINRIRNTAVLTVYRNKREDLSERVGSVDATGFGTVVTDTGADMTVSHRLTPLSSLAGIANWQRTAGDAASTSARQWQVRLVYTTQLRPDASVNLEMRHVRFDSDVQGSEFRENAVVGTLTIKF